MSNAIGINVKLHVFNIAGDHRGNGENRGSFKGTVCGVCVIADWTVQSGGDK